MCRELYLVLLRCGDGGKCFVGVSILFFMSASEVLGEIWTEHRGQRGAMEAGESCFRFLTVTIYLCLSLFPSTRWQEALSALWMAETCASLIPFVLGVARSFLARPVQGPGP